MISSTSYLVVIIFVFYNNLAASATGSELQQQPSALGVNITTTTTTGGSGLNWRKAGCHRLGHTREISIAGCVKFNLTTNACRGYCMSYSVPAAEDLGLAIGHQLDVGGAAGEYIENLPLSQSQSFGDGGVSIITSTTKQTQGSMMHDLSVNNNNNNNENQNIKKSSIVRSLLNNNNHQNYDDRNHDDNDEMQQQQKKYQLTHQIWADNSHPPAPVHNSGTGSVSIDGNTLGSSPRRVWQRLANYVSAPSILNSQQIGGYFDDGAPQTPPKQMIYKMTDSSTIGEQLRRDVVSVSQCCNMMETEDIIVNLKCGLNEIKRLMFKSAKTCECFFCKNV